MEHTNIVPVQSGLMQQPVPPTLEDRLALLQSQLDRQNALLERQTAVLQKQERRAHICLAWFFIKVLLVVLLAAYLGPKVYQAWQQYEHVMAQVNDLSVQVNDFMQEVSGLTTQVQTFLTNVEGQMDTVMATMQTLQTAFTPIADFMSRFS